MLEKIERRVLWLSTNIVHHANNIRPSTDKSKVGGHQASSASVVSIITALYFHFLKAGDRVSIKPHASPAYHAAQYLLGRLDEKYLTTLREYGGLQAYPSRTKDPDPVDFSTGSVGLGAVAPVFAGLSSVYGKLHFGEVTSERFVSLIGDAELDEGNVWETVAEEAIRGLGNVIWIIDLNRQSLDRVIPGVRAARLKALFAGAGWRVFEAKYGFRLEAAMSGPNGAALRQRIDDMSNEEYQVLIRIKDGSELRRRLTDVADPAYRRSIQASVGDIADADLNHLIANLGGHDLPALIDVLNQADAVDDAPTVIFAYTVKGHGLPFAGDPLNHSQLLNQSQMDVIRQSWGIAQTEMWAPFAAGTPEGRLSIEAAARLSAEPSVDQLIDVALVPTSLDVRNPAQTSTQEALGRTMARLADVKGVAERLVTLSPGRGDLNPSLRLDQQGRRLRDGRGARLRRSRPENAEVESGSDRPPHRTRHLGNESLHGPRPVRSLVRVDRPAPDSDRHRLRPICLPWSRCAHLQPLCRQQDDLRGHARRRLAESRGRGAPEHRDAVPRYRIAECDFLRAGLRPRSRMDPCSTRSAAAATASRDRRPICVSPPRPSIRP